MKAYGARGGKAVLRLEMAKSTGELHGRLKLPGSTQQHWYANFPENQEPLPDTWRQKNVIKTPQFWTDL